MFTKKQIRKYLAVMLSGMMIAGMLSGCGLSEEALQKIAGAESALKSALEGTAASEEKSASETTEAAGEQKKEQETKEESKSTVSEASKATAAKNTTAATASDAAKSSAAAKTGAIPVATSSTAVKAATVSNAEWTVLLYLSGGREESEQAAATRVLEEIKKTTPNTSVNVVIETGGAKTWKAKETTGLTISSEKLQRYHYGAGGFAPDQETAISSMAAAETLTDFIKWGVKAYPAKKYMLYLWDCSGGNSTGLITDELYRGSVMSLEDLGRALKDAGTHFEAVATDAGGMASLQAAETVKPWADYLIASEESVAAGDIAYQSPLQYLYDVPSCGGERFGKAFCDAVQQKYAEEGNASASAFLTFSVIDLKKITAVSDAFDRMFSELRGLLADPVRFREYADEMKPAERFSVPQMTDLYDAASRLRNKSLADSTAKDVISAVDNAVVYSVKGTMHSGAHGLSFWYAPNAKTEELDHYARNCKSASCLAFLDAANVSWTAPEWVYEKVKRVPDIRRENYLAEGNIALDEAGMPVLQITNAAGAIETIENCLYRKDEKTGNWLALGTSPNTQPVNYARKTVRGEFTGRWTAVNGMMSAVQKKWETGRYTLYGIPVQIKENGKTRTFELRAAYSVRTASAQGMNIPATASASDAGYYRVFGLWDEADGTGSAAERNAADISGIFGSPLDIILTRTYIEKDGNTMQYTDLKMDAVTTGTITAGPGTAVEEKPLPAGTYAYSFRITDVFGNVTQSDPVEVIWDGMKAQYSLWKN